MGKEFGRGLHELNSNKRVEIARQHVQEMTIAYVLSKIFEVGFTWLKKRRKILSTSITVLAV